MKYIDADKLIAEIEKRIIEHRKSLKKDITSISEATLKGSLCAYKSIEHFIDSLQQEQLDFPTTDEQVKEFLATHPIIKVPEKYKNPDWLFKKQEQPEVDLEKEVDDWYNTMGIPVTADALKETARHFYELGQRTKYQQDREEFAKLKAKEWQKGYDEGYAKGLNARKEE